MLQRIRFESKVLLEDIHISKGDEHIKDISSHAHIKERKPTAVKTAFTTQMASHSVEEPFSKGTKKRSI